MKVNQGKYEAQSSVHRALDLAQRRGAVSSWSVSSNGNCYIIDLAGANVRQHSPIYSLSGAQALCEGLAAGRDALECAHQAERDAEIDAYAAERVDL